MAGGDGHEAVRTERFRARFCGVLAALGSVFLLYRMARLVLEDEKKAFYAAPMFATSWLFLAVARLASTEIYLVCFTIMAQYALFRQLYGQRSWHNALLYGLALGLGFLTKGPIKGFYLAALPGGQTCRPGAPPGFSDRLKSCSGLSPLSRWRCPGI
ncbi:MAG: glycosyltransferase family 39 protein [Syntrophotaleaceae bacterium]